MVYKKLYDPYRYFIINSKVYSVLDNYSLLFDTVTSLATRIILDYCKRYF
jgi:hypothetical protein